MSDFYVGISGGGTKTRMRLYFPVNGEVMNFEGGPSNLCSSNTAEVKGVFQKLFSQINSREIHFEQCRGVGVGAAGINTPLIRMQFMKCLKDLLPEYVPITFATDAQAALYGAVGEYAGLVVIAGTGSVCIGKNAEGCEYQAGGCGHLIDDAGSGYAIGRDILSAVVCHLDGRGEAVVLTDLLAEKMKLRSRNDIIDYVYGNSNPKSRIAAIAPLLIQGCGKNDELSWGIALKAAKQLLLLVSAVVKKLDLGEEIAVLHGGILQNMNPVSETLQKEMTKIYPKIKFVKTEKDELDGALYLAKKMHIDIY